MDSSQEMLHNPETLLTIAQIITQIVAFLIFVFLMRIFAWKPILRLLDERKEKIAGKFKRLEELERQMRELRSEYEDRIKSIDAQARLKIQEAIKEGRRIAREITDSAREESQGILDRARLNLETEVVQARTEIRDEIINMVIMATEKIIQERLDDEKQRALIDSFIQNLEKTSHESG